MSTSFSPVKDLFLLGKTLKSHGTSGQLRLLIEPRFQVYLHPGAFLFFDLDGSKVPFQITAVEEGQHLVIALDGVAGKKESDQLANKEIWIPVVQVQSRHLKSLKNIKEKWENYRISDENTTAMFDIKRTEEYPQQLMAVIDISGREVLIPLHDQLIIDIDKESKVIRMQIPEGLLDL